MTVSSHFIFPKTIELVESCLNLNAKFRFFWICVNNLSEGVSKRNWTKLWKVGVKTTNLYPEQSLLKRLFLEVYNPTLISQWDCRVSTNRHWMKIGKVGDKSTNLNPENISIETLLLGTLWSSVVVKDNRRVNLYDYPR